MKIAIYTKTNLEEENEVAKRGEKNPKRLGYGLARVEFIANFEAISQLIGQGFTMTDVYNHLITEKKISMSISSFKNLCKPDVVKKRNQKKREKNELRSRNGASCQNSK